MTALLSTGDPDPNSQSIQPRPDRPWHSAGVPTVRVDTGDSTVYPYVLYVGDHDPVPVPMTAAGIRALRDSLTELLAASAPANLDDFVAEWASIHHAAVEDGDHAEPSDAVVTARAALPPAPGPAGFRAAA